MVKKLSRLLLIFICLGSCQKLPGKFIYYDNDDVVHIDNNCKYITEVKKARPVRRININEFLIYPDEEEYILTCSSCIDETAYGLLLTRGKTNRYNKSLNYAKMLYRLVAKETDIEFPKFKRFCQLLNNENYRSDLYKQLSIHYKLPAYSDFSDDSLSHIDLYSLTDWEE